MSRVSIEAPYSAHSASPKSKIHEVLTAPPGMEASLCLLMPPELSLYETSAPETASVVSARQDHLRMRETFEDHQIEVFNMRHIIGDALVSRAQHRFQTPEQLLSEVKHRAQLLHQRFGLGNLERTMNELQLILADDVANMGADAAISINGVLTNCIGLDGKERGFDYNEPAAGNFMYMRDPLHMSGDTIGTHTMHHCIRDQEVALAEIGLAALGREFTALKFSSNYSKSGGINVDSIEGGDILHFDLDGELFAVIGQAERTSLAAVEAWYRLHQADFSLAGGVTPIVVQGPNYDTQAAMHIDTFSSQVAPGTIIHCGEISRQRQVSIIYLKNDHLVLEPLGNYGDWLERRANQVYDLSLEDQQNYIPNGLMDGDTFFLTQAGSSEVMSFLTENVLKLENLAISNLTHFYGALHCLTTERR